MDCSRVAQSLDSLWFYSNILTCCRTEDSVPVSVPLACLTDDDQLAPPPPPFHDKEGDVHRPITPLCVLNQENESQPLGVENLNLVPAGCHEIGECSSASVFQKTEKRERKMRKKKKKNKFGVIWGRKEIRGAVELGFGVKQVCGVLNQMLATTQLPPIDDGVVMKKHIKSWAYAVACSVKVN